MRVKLIMALAMASILLLAGTLPSGAVVGVKGIGGTAINIQYPAFVAPVMQSKVVPCISFGAPQAPVTSPSFANTINLGGPALNTAINLYGPQVPSMSAPSFILSQLTPPSITGFSATSPVFSASTPTPTATPSPKPTRPVAGFTVTPIVGPAPLLVHVTDTSTGATSWQYYFGDSTPNATTANPTHTYTANGTYIIVQTVTNSKGSSSTTKTVHVGGNSSGPAVVNLRTAGNYAILSKAGISTTGNTHVNGNMGVSPIDSTAITGFALSLDGSGQFSTSPRVTGRVYAADYTSPTPATLGLAVLDMQAAYTDAAGRPNPDVVGLGGGQIGGYTLTPGLYKWTTDVSVTTGDLTLDAGGNPNAVWIFQISGNLNVASGRKIVLTGGAQAKNVFWQVGGANANIGTGAQFNGIILAQAGITLQTGATMNGILLAQTAVTLDGNTVTKT